MNNSFDVIRYNAENDEQPRQRSRYTKAEIDAAWDRVLAGPVAGCALGASCQAPWSTDGRCAGCAGRGVQA